MSLILVLSFAGCSGKIIEEETTDVAETTTEEFHQPYEFEVYSFNAEEATIIKSEISTSLSDKAKEVLIKFDLDRRAYAEGTDSTKTKLVLYNVFNYRGIDETGLYYTPDGTPEEPHSPCGKQYGIGENMCSGFCNVEFNIG